MKILRVRFSVELIEATLSLSFHSATPLECVSGLPKGAKLAEAHLIEDHGKPTHLALFFVTDEGDGVEDLAIRYRHVHEEKKEKEEKKP